MQERFMIYNIWDSKVIAANFLNQEEANQYIDNVLSDQNKDLLAIMPYVKPDPKMYESVQDED